MAWIRRRRPELPVAAEKNKAVVVASATVLQGADAPSSQQNPQMRALVRAFDQWQKEVWDFYDELGEFRQGVTWKANMMSRVRLRAAKIVSGQDEPEIVDTGPAHDIVRQLAGGVGGQSSIMSEFAKHLSVPGECYLIGETVGATNTNTWYARSIEEVQGSTTNPGGYRVKDERGAWKELSDNSLVVRVHRPHPRWHNVADSPARAARPLLRELELVNRHIQAQYISRLASAGVVIFPEEVSFPVREEFADAPDPFVAEWIEVAAEAIKTPGTAASVVPIPIKVPGEHLEKIKHIDFTLKLDDQIVTKRNSALARLGIELDMPPEALLGMNDVNHWNAWLIDEQGVKIHVAPDAEVICDALTVGYLHPLLKADGEDPDEWVVWYDASELILRPDRSASAKDAYDRGELSGTAFRRELGFDDSDAPTDDELETIILKHIALTQQINAFSAMDELGYSTTHDTPPSAPRPATPPMPDNPDIKAPVPPQDQPDNVPPGRQTPAAPPRTADNRREQLLVQGNLMHAVKITLTGWQLLHPQECREHLFGCPVTHATWRPEISAMPGTSGVYRCWLNAEGKPIIGAKIFNGDVEAMLETSARPFQSISV